MSKNIVYDMILSDPEFVWSYTRIKQFADCEYAWMLKYLEDEPSHELFFGQFGSFMHEIYRQILVGELDPKDAKETYLTYFCSNVTAKAPNEKIFQKYFYDGLRASEFAPVITDAFTNGYTVVDSELKVDFDFAGYNFVGFIDLLLEDTNGNLIIVDHKSRTLKPRSNRAKPTKSDEMLDEYLRQLYIYSEAVRQTFGKLPKELWFHCFRNGEDDDENVEKVLIKHEFDSAMFESTKLWVTDIIEKIKNTDVWHPNCDTFYCTHLCGCHDSCEYYSMMKGK